MNRTYFIYSGNTLLVRKLTAKGGADEMRKLAEKGFKDLNMTIEAKGE